MIDQAQTLPRSLLIWIAAAAILDIAGAQHVYTQPAIAASALALLALLTLLPGAPLRWHSALVLLPMIALVASMVDLATFVPPDGGWSALRLGILFGGIAVLLLAARIGSMAIALAALVLGVVIRVIHMRHIAVVPVNGDMLPLVNGAINNLLAGNSPYAMYKMPWDVPLTYLPITWLSYIPAYLSRLDLRWTNMAAEVAVGGALVWLGTNRSNWTAMLRNSPALVLWAWLFLQPSVIHWDTGNTAPITWALLAMLFAAVLLGRDRLSAVALGFAAAGTPLIAVFGPFVALHWIRSRGWRATLRMLFISGIVAAVFIVPFLVWSPGDFVLGTYRWFNQIDGWPRQKWLETDPHVWGIITGFSGEFWARGTEGWLKPIQALIVLLVLALYGWRGGLRADLAPHAAAAYLGFMLFNPVLWPYLYNPVLVVGLVGIAGRATAQPVAAPVAVDAARVSPSLARNETV